MSLAPVMRESCLARCHVWMGKHGVGGGLESVVQEQRVCLNGQSGLGRRRSVASSTRCDGRVRYVLAARDMREEVPVTMRSQSIALIGGYEDMGSEYSRSPEWQYRQENEENKERMNEEDEEHTNGAVTRSRPLAPAQPPTEINEIRSKLNKKLSEANMYNRHLLREVQARDRALQECKLALAAMDLELSVLMSLADEIAREGGRPGTRKINGRYIQSHLALRLHGLDNMLKGQIADVDLMRLRDAPMVWYGMAEEVRVMGSFDGWTHGEQMSPESTGTYTKFQCTLKLRPGRYEIKFCVDGEWRIAPNWPTTGEGLTENNLLVVE